MRLVAAGLTAACLCACASDDGADLSQASLPRETGRNLALDTHQKPLQCVPYARDHSGVKIYGDAWTWWDKAAGKFARGKTPADGAVLVLADYAGPQRAHVAVVRKLISPREIRVDHANWLDDGSIYLNDPVVDVSTDNDWSAVKVWNIKAGGWGGHVYPVQGFILPAGPGADPAANDRVARADIAPGDPPDQR